MFFIRSKTTYWDRLKLLLVILLYGGVLSAQQYNFQHYTVANGLPQSQVNCVYQDNNGYIWVGTEGGVSRFDGLIFDQFNGGDDIPGTEVTAITETDEGILLATDSGIVVYAKGKFKLYLYPWRDNTVKINFFFKGLNEENVIATSKGLYSFSKGSYTFINTGSPVDQLSVRAVHRDREKQLWIGTERNGVFQLVTNGNKYINHGFVQQEKLSNAYIRGFVEVEPGKIWIATSGDGVYEYNEGTVRTIELPDKIRTSYFTCVHKDQSGDIWLGTWGKGVIRYSDSTFQMLNKSNGLGDDVVTAIQSDEQGNMWFATFSSGLVFFYGEQFFSFTQKDGLPDNNVRAVQRDLKGNMWIATLGGIAVFDGARWTTFAEKNGLSYNRVGALTADDKGRIYAGTMSGEINVFESVSSSPKVYQISNSAQQHPGEILSLEYSNNNFLWIGTSTSGLFKLQNDQIEAVNTGNILLGNPIWAIYEDEQSTIWLGTEHGLFVFKNDSITRPSGLSSKDINRLDQSIYDITGDDIYTYAATHRSGIWRYNRSNQTGQFIDKKNGLGSSFTRGLLQYDEQTIYATTILGLDQINSRDQKKTVQHYWYTDGIGTSNFTPGAINYDLNNRIWFGSTDGIIVFSPKLRRDNSSAPRIQLKSVLLFNQEVNWSLYTDSLQHDGLPNSPILPYNLNNITFTLAGIQFGAGVNIGYEYRLEGGGSDTNWVRQLTGNSVAFQNLSPGDYVFRVQAFNGNGFYSKQYVFKFKIQPPFWSTGWFFLIVLIAMIAIVVILLFAYRRYREEFLKDQRSLQNHQQSTARLFLISSGIVYPISGITIMLFQDDIDLQPIIQFSIGIFSIICGIATYTSSFFRRKAYQISHFTLAIILLHLIVLNYINHLHPVVAISLIIALGAVSIVYDKIRSLIVISIVLILSSLFLIYFETGQSKMYNHWLFLLFVVIALIVAFVSIVSRLNLLNRLLFADTALNNSRSLVIACNRTGEIVFVSSSTTQILGYDPKELMGDGWWKVRSGDQEENIRMRDSIIRDENLSASYISPVRAKNGAIRWIQWVDTQIDANIKVGIGLDISERHEIEERYRYIVEAATDIIYTADHNGHFTYVNDVAVKILGYPMEELLGRHFTDLVHPEWLKEVQSFYEKQFQRRLTVTNLEFPVIRTDGGVVWVGQTVRILFDEKHPDKIRGFQSIARDITEKKQYEEELEKLSLVASETTNGVLICDSDSAIEWVNEGFTRITGYSLAEVRNRRSGDVLNGVKTDMEVIYAAREKTLAGEGFEVELLVYHKDGSELWISVSNTPIVDENGRLLKQIEIFTDISEKKRYEIQLSHYSKRLELLNAAKQVLVFSDSIDVIASNVLEIFTDQLTYCDRMSIGLFNEQSTEAEVMTLKRRMNQKEELTKQVVSISSFRSIHALRRNQHFLVDDLREVESPSNHENYIIAEEILSYLVMPLFTEDGLIGFVSISTKQANKIEAEDIDLMRELADVTAATIQKLRYQNIIQQKNTDISASINYARRIQDSILPPENHVKEILGDVFILYRPKDVLSGDYYWLETRDNYSFVAVADSTGHGVPGALLSLMGHNLLNQAIQERHLTSPSDILDYLNTGIQQTLNQYKKEGELRDGMDIVLCVFERNSKRLMYAGAINPLYIVRNDELIQLKGNRFSIGSYYDQKLRPFSLQEFELQEGDLLYLFTDGFADQFGGDSDRKLSHRRFRELLLSLQNMPMHAQREVLNNQLEAWMGGVAQTDDVCVLGIRIQ